MLDECPAAKYDYPRPLQICFLVSSWVAMCGVKPSEPLNWRSTWSSVFTTLNYHCQLCVVTDDECSSWWLMVPCSVAGEHLSLRHRLHPSASVDCLIGVVMSPGGELTSLTVSGLIASYGEFGSQRCISSLSDDTHQMPVTSATYSWDVVHRRLCQLAISSP